ncbi:MAG TPA: hypothetical protein VM536_06440 [Chloroflexia bacterium]|nr:hypothetical protein [Chloroflexia bacterium]
MVAQQWDVCMVEWIWTESDIALYTTEGPQARSKGAYSEVARLLAELGSQGWEVATCAGAGNWLLWTLKRPL